MHCSYWDLKIKWLHQSFKWIHRLYNNFILHIICWKNMKTWSFLIVRNFIAFLFLPESLFIPLFLHRILPWGYTFMYLKVTYWSIFYIICGGNISIFFEAEIEVLLWVITKILLVHNWPKQYKHVTFFEKYSLEMHLLIRWVGLFLPQLIHIYWMITIYC